MARSSKKTVVLVKIENEPGVEAVPDPSADAIPVLSADPTPNFDFLQNAELSATLSQRPGIPAGGTWKIELKTYVRGSGDKTVEPRLGRLLEACSFKKEQVDSDGDGYNDTFLYTPISDLSAQKTLTIYLYKDGELYKFVGCMGDMSLDANVRQFPELSFTFTGKLLERAEAPAPVATYEPTKPAVFYNALCKIDNTYAPRFSKVSIGLNNNVAPVDDANEPDGIWRVFINDRKPSGSFDPMATLPSEYDFLTKFKAGEVADLSFTVGQESGNKVEFNCRIQYSDYKLGDRESFLTYELPFNLVSEAGDDELTIAFK